MSWLRLDPRCLRNIGTPYGAAARAYGWNGKRFPRLVISFYRLPHDDGLTLGISRKRRPGDLWTRCGLPDELIPELCALLTEFSPPHEVPHDP